MSGNPKRDAHLAEGRETFAVVRWALRISTSASRDLPPWQVVPAQ